MSAPNPIPLFRAVVPDAARERVSRVLDSGWIGYGPECRRLEQAFLRGRGGWALATSACTSSLNLVGRLLAGRGAGARGEVIVPAVSFVATAMAFAEAGLDPVVTAVRDDDLTLDARDVERAITPRTRAICVVHLYGQRATDLPGLRALADRHAIALVEDCAHRIDLLDSSAPIGDYACYSFNAVKELPCGEGGLLWGRDPGDEAAARAASNLGLAIDTAQRAATLRHGDYAFEPTTGLKLRLSDLSAAVVNGCLPSLAATRARRRALVERYARLLGPYAPDVVPLSRCDDDSFLMAVVRVPSAHRERIRASMAADGVATSVHYPSLARHPRFGAPGIARGGCANADLAVLTLPTWLGMEADVQQRVVDALARALDASAGSRGARTAPAG